MINVAFTSTGYGPIHPNVVASWLRAIAYASRHFQTEQLGKVGGAGVTDKMYTMTAENRLIKEMLVEREDTDPFTHIFMTESDMILDREPVPMGKQFLPVGSQIGNLLVVMEYTPV